MRILLIFKSFILRRPRLIMVRKKRLVENGIYHVIQRAPGDELLFKSNKDRYVFIRFMKTILQQFNIKILSYSLMPNHIHIQLQIKSINLSKCMKRLFETYAIYFNRTYRRKGHVFYGVYRAVYCDSYFSTLVVSCYIHLNAYKARLVETPFDYQWDSLQSYVSERNQKSISSELVLTNLDSNAKIAKKKYKNLISKVATFRYKNIINNPEALEEFYKACSKKDLLFEIIGGPTS